MSDVKWKLVPVEPTPAMMDAAITLVEAGACFPQDIYAAMVKAAATSPAEALPAGVEAGMSDYDAGLLNDWGGGNVDWWQDYLRAEIGRANDFWRSQVAALSASAPAPEERT